MKHLRIITVAVLIGILLPQFSGAVWFDTSWSNKFSITSNETLVDGNLTNFPAFYDCANAPAGFWTTVKGDGSDIRITSSSQTGTLFHELVEFSTSSQTCEIHFDTVSMSSTTPDTFYIYYGNAGASSISTSSTWNSDYVAVYHMSDASGGIIDSTSNGNDGIERGSPTYQQTGKIGSAISFDGSSDYFELPASLRGEGNQHAMFVWLKRGRINTVEVFWGNVNGATGYYSRFNSNNSYQLIKQGVVNLTGNSSITDTSNFLHMVHISRSTGMEVYLNGSSDGSNGNTSNISQYNSWVGLGAVNESNSANDHFQGDIDEFRIIKNINVSVNWISTEYNNQASSTAFFAASAEESVPIVDNIGGIRMGFNF